MMILVVSEMFKKLSARLAQAPRPRLLA